MTSFRHARLIHRVARAPRADRKLGIERTDAHSRAPAVRRQDRAQLVGDAGVERDRAARRRHTVRDHIDLSNNGLRTVLPVIMTPGSLYNFRHIFF